MLKQNKQADELPIVLGQRLHDISEDFSLMARDAASTYSHDMLYSLANTALEVFAIASADREQQEWSGHAILVTYWAGFLEGVRTQKQKQRKKRTKEKPLSDPDARRQALKILANDEQQSL